MFCGHSPHTLLICTEVSEIDIVNTDRLACDAALETVVVGIACRDRHGTWMDRR